MKCSVSLPVVNGAGTVAQAIDSILSQSEKDFELLIIDDKSRDRSAEIIRDYVRRDPRVHGVFHDRSLGLAATLNDGLERAGADLVVRIDQDQESPPVRMRLQGGYVTTN